MFPNESDVEYKLEDEWERVMWADRVVDDETGEIITEEQEMLKYRLATARQILEQCKGHEVA